VFASLNFLRIFKPFSQQQLLASTSLLFGSVPYFSSLMFLSLCFKKNSAADFPSVGNG
jgi:hypothetical protein